MVITGVLPGEKCVIKYRAVVGMNAKYGENENYAYATANTPADARTQSAEARATVVIKPGFISDVGFIFGKVYFDLNQNGEHDSGEPTAGDVELITETGIRVVTDEFGKYSIPNVRPGRHILRVNRQSLPERTHVLLNSADFMGDAISRAVDVSPGGMAKANFALEQEVDMAMLITEISTLTLTQHPLTTDFRQVVYKPWRTTFRLGFLSGEAKLRPELFSALRKASDFLRWQKQVIIEIDGHTNDVPISDASNYKDNFQLSKARAEAIKQFLVDEMGIAAERITTHGYGPTRPIASNETEDGKHLNRRVEMIFHNPEEDLPYNQELRFRVDMMKKGNARLTDVTFHEILPNGFTYKPNTASFKGRPLEPVAVTETEAIWYLGAWTDEETLQSIEFALEPNDHSRIPTISSSKSYIGFLNDVGVRDSTTALQTNMITQIEETLLRINMQEANFDLNSAQLRSQAYMELNKLGDFMVWQKDFTITIKGFTDNTGTFDYNMQLSRNRAESVKDYLLDHFPIDRDRIETSFYGPLYPVAGNDTPAGRAKNRRVELLVNSDFQQEFVVKVDASRDSLAYRILVEHALTDSGKVTQSIALKPGIPAPYLLNLALTDYEDVDSVQVSVRLPEGLVIQNGDAAGIQAEASTWVFPVGENPRVFRKEFMLEIEETSPGENAARFEVLPIMKDRYYGKSLEQTVIVKKKN
ncbi:MAG: OmpA family protein [Lentisphaeria bacterium]|nr:OmpA family protein [Candidatus Neomarinimicrobiota bacterium]MCF7842723.1 OmpA family protein [Lentisphaeria bacterium]